jgi:hypothetical protein
MPRKTATATREPPVAHVTAPEREALATQALAQTREKLHALAARLGAISAELADVDAEERAAEERAAAAQAHAAAQPELVAGARARLLVYSASPAEAFSRADVEHAEAALQEAQARAEAATAGAATAHAEATITRERLNNERAEVEGVQQSLSELISHLEAELIATREQRGAEILTVAKLRAAVFEQVVATREHELAASREKLAAHCEQARAELAAYPAALASTAGTLLEASRQSTPGERLVEAYVAFLETLERERRHPELDVEAPGPVAPLQLFETPAPQVLAGVLAGINLTFVPGKLAMARAWLDSVRESQQTA